MNTPNQNWANEVGTSFFADESDLNKDGWLDPWNRPLIKANCPSYGTTPEGWFVKITCVRHPSTKKSISLAIYNSPLPQHVIGKLTELLSLKFWYGGRAIYPYHHPVNKVQNAMMLMLDGCPMYKFQVHKNGKLRLMRIYGKNPDFNLKLKPLQTITAEELINKIALLSDKKAGSYMQMTNRTPIPVDLVSWNKLMQYRRAAKKALLNNSTK